MSNNALEVLNVSFEYAGGVRALSDVSLTISEGEFVVLLGPSGSGKSSLLAMIAGFMRPTQGSISVFGEALIGPGPDRGIAFQHHSLFPWKTALQNVMYPLECRGLDRSTAYNTSVNWLTEVGLEGFENAYPGELSGGMQQRVALARLFSADPRIFLLDEPFGALDAYAKLQMQELLLRIWDKHRRTVLFVTHDIEEALLLADQVLIMGCSPGTIVEQFAVPMRRPRSAPALFIPEVVRIRQHVFSLMQQEDQKKSLFKLSRAERAGSQGNLRIGYVPDVAALPLLAASKRIDHGESVELVVKANGDVIIQEVASGQLDIGEVSLVSAILSARRGKRFKIISGWGALNDQDSDLVAIYGPDLPSLEAPAALHQKRVGLNGFGTLSEFLVRRAFQDTGQIPQLISLRAESFKIALEQEVVDAVAAMAPWLTSVRDIPGLKEIHSLNAYLPPGPLFVLVASDETIQSRGRIIGEFLASCRARWEEVQSSPEVSEQLICKFFGVRAPGSSRYFALRKCERVNVGDIQTLYEQLVTVRMITETGQFNCSDLIQSLID
jgi:NitT/TauT family transport system ATP-binding protein